MGLFNKKIGCGKAFQDDECEDNYQFWFCGLEDSDDNEIHYCPKCIKRKNKNDDLRGKSVK